MSSMPECKRCGNYVHHGPVICDDCLTSVLDEVDRHLVGTVGSNWTYAKDIAGVIRQAFSCGRSRSDYYEAEAIIEELRKRSNASLEARAETTNNGGSGNE